MVRDYKERFQGLVNKNVPRTFLKSVEGRSGHLNETDYGKPLSDWDESLPMPEDGFVARYCRE